MLIVLIFEFFESNIGSFLDFFFHCASGTVASSHCMGISVMEMLLKCEYIINSQRICAIDNLKQVEWSGVLANLPRFTWVLWHLTAWA